MRFYTLEEKKPEYGERVLVKIRPAGEKFHYYYMVCRTIERVPIFIKGEWEWEDQDVYKETMGEQYTYWKEKDIVGWCSCDEIEKNEGWN